MCGDTSKRRRTDGGLVANVLHGRVSAVSGGKVAFPRLDLCADEREIGHGYNVCGFKVGITKQAFVSNGDGLWCLLSMAVHTTLQASSRARYPRRPRILS